MNRFYAVHHEKYNIYDNPIKFIFASKRLVNTIRKNNFSWLYQYFELNQSLFFGDYNAVLISSNGTILFIKKSNKEVK